MHIHAPDFSLALGRAYPTVPIVYSLHDPIDWRRVLYALFSSPNQWFVSISDAQRSPNPNLHYAATVYNGIEVKEFPLSEKPGSSLLYVGRVMRQKGVAESIAVARALGEELNIFGPISAGPGAPEDYWENEIKPQLTEKIRHRGTVDRSQLFTYYQRAKALLMLIQWEEPFGLVMIEAMACWTPVIAFNRGSVPEVVVDGKTGFIVNTVEEMAAAVKKIDTIDRRACREHVEKNFSFDRMVAGYEEVYEKVIAASQA